MSLDDDDNEVEAPPCPPKEARSLTTGRVTASGCSLQHAAPLAHPRVSPTGIGSCSIAAS